MGYIKKTLEQILNANKIQAKLNLDLQKESNFSLHLKKKFLSSVNISCKVLLNIYLDNQTVREIQNICVK